MRNFLKIFMVSVIITLFSSHGVSANSADFGIEVKGQASIYAKPDNFALSIAIIEQGRFTDKIRVIVDDKSNQVIQIAQQLGIKPNNINSARVSLRVIKGQSELDLQGVEVNQRLHNNQKSSVYVGSNSPVNKQNINNQLFELRRNITVTFTNIKNYDQFLNRVIKIGASEISPLAMNVGDTTTYYQQALIQAIKNAKVKAQLIAQQSGQDLDKLIYVKELSSNHYRAQRMLSNSSFGHNSQVGNQAINASVTVKYSMK